LGKNTKTEKKTRKKKGGMGWVLVSAQLDAAEFTQSLRIDDTGHQSLEYNAEQIVAVI